MILDKFQLYLKRSLLVAGLGAIVILFLKLKACVTPKPPTTLQPGELVQVHYNNETHKLTTITPTHTDTIYADNPTVHIAPGGYVLTENHPIGAKLSPFIGLGYGDTMRFHAGLTLFHAWRIGGNAALAFTSNPRYVAVVPVISVSYNFYGNLDLFVGVNPIDVVVPTQSRLSYLHGGIMVRFW